MMTIRFKGTRNMFMTVARAETKKKKFKKKDLIIGKISIATI